MANEHVASICAEFPKPVMYVHKEIKTFSRDKKEKKEKKG